MPNYRRANVQGGTYFFTVVTEKRQKILTLPDVREALRGAIEKTRAKHPFVIDAWVLMPDHLHTIWTLPENDADFSSRWSLIKQFTTFECGQKYKNESLLTERRAQKRQGTMWQNRFYEHMIKDDVDYQAHINYLHFNPVKHGLVVAVKDWPYSSFHLWVKNGVYEDDWGGDSVVDIYDDVE